MCKLKEYSTVYEQRDTSVPRMHHADYRDKGNWGSLQLTPETYIERSIALSNLNRKGYFVFNYGLIFTA